MKKRIASMLAVLGITTVVGCGAEGADTAATVDDDGLAEQQLIYSTNADGTWSANALKPQFLGEDYWTLSAQADFTGPSGKTRKMGVCLLQHTSTPCTSVANCGSAPSTLPAGGARYCTGANGSSTKYCAFRPGYASDFCAGSPAHGGAAVSPGHQDSPWQTVGGVAQYLSYACFEGCSATDPSSSSLSLSPIYCQKNPSKC